MANKYKIPKFKLQAKTPSEKGITAQFIRLNIKDNSGAKRNIPVSAFEGRVNSFVNNFKPSAKDCTKPK